MNLELKDTQIKSKDIFMKTTENIETNASNTVTTTKASAPTSKSDIYNDDNLFIGQNEEQQEAPKKEFEEWFKVKIQGVVTSYRLHDDGSLQLKFQEKVERTIDGITFNDYSDKSIRIRENSTSFNSEEIKKIVGRSVEIINVSERAQYKKLADGEYDFNKIENYFYSADNLKIINKDVENGYQLYKIFEFRVKDITPALLYDARKRKQSIDKSKSILLYEVSNGSLSTLHKIIVDGLTFNQAYELKGKEIIVMDLTQAGKNYYCSKIKLK